MMKTILRSDEFSCPSCVAKIEKALKTQDGVQDAKVHFNTGRIEIEHDAERVHAEDLVATVRDIGYEARVAPF